MTMFSVSSVSNEVPDRIFRVNGILCKIVNKGLSLRTKIGIMSELSMPDHALPELQ